MSDGQQDVRTPEVGSYDAPAIRSTGVPGLDAVLGGGLRRGALALIVGPPGSGKTTLAAQIAFAAAKIGQRALILTALSEPSDKLVQHLRTLGFFDVSLVGDSVQIISLGQFLNSGLEATADALVDATRRLRADLVVIDGFRGIRGVATVPHEPRQFLYDVGGRLNVLGATVLVTSEADARDSTLYPEATTADVILGLSFGLAGVRQRRGLEVLKVRGAAPLPGLHGLVLDGQGATIYPRLEARVVPQAADAMSAADAAAQILATPTTVPARVPTSLPELDTMLGGGLTQGTRTLVIGRVGTGKTLLGLHFALDGVRGGTRTVYLNLRESPAELAQKADAFAIGPELRAALRAGNLTLLRLAPVELDPDRLATQLFETLDQTNAERLVIDSIAEVERAVVERDPGRISGFLVALVEALRARSVTSLFIKETRQIHPGSVDFADDPLAILAENVLLLRQVERGSRQHRVLAVLKMGFSDYDTTLREFVIAPPDGIRVLAPFEGDRALLSDVARSDGDADL
jgi:circadian clock protein KaiC